MAKTIKTLEGVTHGTDNLFADLGYPDAMRRQARLRLAFVLNHALTERKLSRAKTARTLGVTPESVSKLRDYQDREAPEHRGGES